MAQLGREFLEAPRFFRCSAAGAANYKLQTKNTMKKIVLFLATLATLASARAQEPKSSYSVTTDFAYSSDYVFRGVKQADDSFQPSAEISYQGAYLGVWTNEPIKGHEDNEIDTYAGYKYKLSDNVSFEAVGTYYWYPEAKGASTKHSYEGGVGATYSLHGVTASAYYYHDFKLNSNTEQGSVGYSLPLEAIGASLDLTAFIGTAQADNWAPWSGVSVKQSYNYYGADVSVPYKLSEKATLTVGAHWAHNDGLPGVDNDHIWWSAGLTIGF